MLRRLRIENLVLIREAELDLAPGLIALTGETGAGKTIVTQAIGLLLGAKGDAASVGAAGNEAYVEAELDVPDGFFDEDGLEPCAISAPGTSRAGRRSPGDRRRALPRMPGAGAWPATTSSPPPIASWLSRGSSPSGGSPVPPISSTCWTRSSGRSSASGARTRGTRGGHSRQRRGVSTSWSTAPARNVPGWTS